jgi:hypothetical protein
MDGVIRKALEFLLGARNDDGGWSYLVGSQSYPEPTCYSVLAFSGVDSSILPTAEVVEGGLEWLRAYLDPSGALVLDNDNEPHWGISLALLTLSHTQNNDVFKKRCVRCLLNWEGNPLDSDAIAPMDTQLIGWPWISGTFSWVEPTSYAILALKHLGYGTHPRVEEAERMLLDRACTDGGWNYGNRVVFGQELSAFAPTTALALMALQDNPSASNAVEHGLVFLAETARQYPSTLSLSLAILCLNLYQQQTEPLIVLLLDRQQSDGSWRHAGHLTALSVLALQSAWEDRNVFKL